jgi:hypothetical protein
MSTILKQFFKSTPWFGDKDINQTFLKKTLIFGDVDKVYKDDVYNAILLNIKYYIYTNKCLKYMKLVACDTKFNND